MISGIGEVESRDMPLSECQVLHCAIKTRDGLLEVDARKWSTFKGQDNYIPSRKGLQMKPEDWKRAIPLILELLDSAEGKESKK